MIANEADLQWIVTRITALLDLDRIYLFGSYAAGTAHERSDLDLLIIGSSALPRLQRGKDVVSALRAFPVPFDLLFFTPQELEEDLKDGRSFISAVMANARLLYSRPPRHKAAATWELRGLAIDSE
jgi:predicted nucleotidyltransferase